MAPLIMISGMHKILLIIKLFTRLAYQNMVDTDHVATEVYIIYSKTLKMHNFLILGSRMHIVFTYCFIPRELCFCHFSSST